VLGTAKFCAAGLTYLNYSERLRHGLERLGICRKRELALVGATKELTDCGGELWPDGFIARYNFAKLGRSQFLWRQIERGGDVVSQVL